MGGISVNVMNLGAIADMIGSGIARNDAGGQANRWSELAQKLGGAGVLEINFASEGISGKIGSGGIDLGGNLYTFAKRMNDRARLESYGQNHSQAQSDAAYWAYVYGDWTQETTAARIASEKDVLEIVSGDGKPAGWTAQTVQNGEGNGRIIQMLDSGDKHINAILLGHESYRDGVITDHSSQKAETINAVLAHSAMAERMTQYNQKLSGTLALEAALYKAGRTDILAALADGMYDSSGDYWKLVKQENGKYGLMYDGNHSLVDEKGNIIIKNDMDEFDENGNISGHRLTSENSYAASLGMLMGTFTDYSNDYDSYYNGATEANPLGVSKQILRDNAIVWQNGQYINTENVIDANPFLMTKIGIETKTGIRTINLGNNTLTLVSVKDEYNKTVSLISNFDTSETGKTVTNLTSIENMVPEGQRLKAGTIKFENGDVSIYGLASTMPDPNKMSEKYPALADGTYYYAWSLHNPNSGNAYPAMRLFQSKPNSWNEITGTTNYPNFQSGTGDWGYLRDSFPAYYYDKLGNIVFTTTDAINGHKTNNTYTNSSSSTSGFIGGSLGCQTWYPTTWNQMTSNFAFNYKPVYGLYTVNRTLFGDGTNKKNNWSNEKWWK